MAIRNRRVSLLIVACAFNLRQHVFKPLAAASGLGIPLQRSQHIRVIPLSFGRITRSQHDVVEQIGKVKNDLVISLPSPRSDIKESIIQSPVQKTGIAHRITRSISEGARLLSMDF